MDLVLHKWRVVMTPSGTQVEGSNDIECYTSVGWWCYTAYSNNDKDTHRPLVVQGTCKLYLLPLTQGISLAAGGIPTPHIV